MRATALDYLACPTCKQKLDIAQTLVTDGDHVIDGVLKCSGCAIEYPIRRGVPRLLTLSTKQIDLDTGKAYDGYFSSIVPDSNSQENTLYGLTVSEEIADFCTKTGITDLKSLAGYALLDAGCGLGRIDGVLAQDCRVVVAFDITSSVERAFATWRDVPNIHIAQASMTAIPVPKKCFDFVWCDGVLPYVSEFETSLRELIETRTSHGSLYTWCYDTSVTLSERIGRLFHQTKLPVRIRRVLISITATILKVSASIVKQKNLLGTIGSFTQHTLDWSLAGHVNHTSEKQMSTIASDVLKQSDTAGQSIIQVSKRQRYVELRIKPHTVR